MHISIVINFGLEYMVLHTFRFWTTERKEAYMSEVELKMAQRAQDPVFEGARSAKNETLELSLDATYGFLFFARE